MWSSLLFAATVLTAHGLQLQWSAPPPCPSHADVLAQVSRYLQPHTLDGGGPASTQASVVIREMGSGWKAHIKTRTANVSGQRVINGASCSEVTAASALILAMLVDPEAVRGASPAPPTGVSLPTVQTEGADDVDSTTAEVENIFVPSRAPAMASWHLGAAGQFADGLLPKLAAGISLRAGHMTGDWEVDLSAQAWRQSSQSLALDADAGGTFGAYAFGLRLWRAIIASQQAHWRGSAGIDGSVITGSGYGVSLPRQPAAKGLDFACATEAERKVTANVALSLTAEVLLPTYRPRFVLQDRGAVWRRPAAAAIVRISVNYYF